MLSWRLLLIICSVVFLLHLIDPLLLLSIEYEIIKAWLDNNISEELIKEAIKEATYNGVSNLRYIDKILYEWGKIGIKSAKDVENNRKK